MGGTPAQNASALETIVIAPGDPDTNGNLAQWNCGRAVQRYDWRQWGCDALHLCDYRVPSLRGSA